LVEFQILVASGVPSVAAHLLSNHYNLTRQQYYRELDRASRSGGDALPFVQYAVTGFVDGLRSQLQMVREQQLSLAWSDYVNDMLSDTVEGKLRQVNRRRRTLVLHLASKPDSVPLGEITDIGPEVARWYATKTTKTLQRDLKALVDLGLITRVGGDRFRANREIILAFLPAQREP
jgi:DNA-binding HxlR family transcriptional regulator